MRPVPSDYRQSRLEEGVERTIDLDGSVYHYWDKGSGPPIVLIPGFGGSSYDWRFFYDDLVSAGFRAIALEILGTGYSDKPVTADYSVHAQARRIANFLRTLKLEKAHIVGASYGGGLALRLALADPQLVDRLVLIDAASMPQKFPYHVRILRTPVLGGIVSTVTPKTFLVHGLLKEIYFDDSQIRTQDIQEYAYEMSLPGTVRAMRHITRSLDMKRITQWATEYRTIQMPTLLLWGEEDTLIPFTIGKALSAEISGSKLIPFPRCGHCPHMEVPKETCREILAFLGAPPSQVPPNGTHRSIVP